MIIGANTASTLSRYVAMWVSVCVCVCMLAQ